MVTFKQQCVELRKQDHTLSEIIKITGRPKTSVYFHIKNLPLSERRKKEIREINYLHILKVSQRRKGKSLRAFKKFSKWDLKTVLLVAHLLFDGEIKYNGCIYNNRSNELIQKVERAMRTIYSFEPIKYRNKNTGVYRISYFNVALASYVKGKSEMLYKEIIHLPQELKREFIRAFFDDEGCVDFNFRDKRRRVRGYQKDIAVLELVQELLLNFGIVAKIQLPNEIVISNRENLVKFQKEINFSPGVKVNGNRSNSTWKRHLEKRTILNKALGSYL